MYEEYIEEDLVHNRPLFTLLFNSSYCDNSADSPAIAVTMLNFSQKRKVKIHPEAQKPQSIMPRFKK